MDFSKALEGAKTSTRKTQNFLPLLDSSCQGWIYQSLLPFAKYKVEVSSPLRPKDENEVCMDEICRRPSSRAIGLDRIYITPDSLALSGRELLDLLCEELHLASKDCFLSAPPSRTARY